MEKILLIAGCSHAAGSEINGQEDSVHNRQHSFGAILARHLGYTPVNIALNGSTNTGIARSVLKWFEKRYDPDSMEVFVLVAWTECARLEIPTNRTYFYNASSRSADWYDHTANNYMRVAFGWDGGDAEERSLVPYYHKFMAQNETLLELMTMQSIIQLQSFFKSKNLDYLMCNSSHVFSSDSPQLRDYITLIDRTKYYNMLENESAFYTKYKNLGYKNDKAKYWHHDEVPHQLYAAELIQFLESNK